jgi:MFS superfamily sulfate permease-like transporter
LAAGISVAAVAIPVVVAYAQLAGFNPVYGLYSSILPLVAYAVFGTSRQLIVNPDAATCALVAAAVAPLAGSDSDLYSFAFSHFDLLKWITLHWCKFSSSRCAGGLFVETNLSWVFEWYCA